MALCECGCGQDAGVYSRTDPRKGMVKGEPKRFRNHHHHHLKAKGKPKFIVDPETGCHLWQRSMRNSDGYGNIRVKNKLYFAHRYYYEQRHGPVPEGLCLDHLCRTPACVNPDHLEVVTPAENLRRGLAAKLSMDKARFIRSSESSVQTLARLFDVSEGCIQSVRRGHTWKEPAEAGSVPS